MSKSLKLSTAIKSQTLILHPHQQDALDHMADKEKGPLKGGLLCLMMGLGKTVVIYRKAQIEKSLMLIICSKTIIIEWINEHQKFFPDLKVLIYHREFYDNFDSLSLSDIENYNIVITTYDVIIGIDRVCKFSNSICIYGTEGPHINKVVGYSQKTKPDVYEGQGPNVLYTVPWKRVVIDEAQKIANSKTQIFRAICGIYSEYRWCLTGSPIKNVDSDMWSLLFFCGLKEPNNPKHFQYSDFIKYSDVMMVREYKQTHIRLPEIIHHTFNAPLSPIEYEIYKYYIDCIWEAYDNFVHHTNSDETFGKILGLFTRLRQICISPYLLCPQSKRRSSEDDVFESPYNDYICDKEKSGFSSSKIQKIQEIIDGIPTTDKIVIFSSFTACLDLLYDKLKDNYDLILLDGSTTGKKRLELLYSFRHGTPRILLCNFKVGSEGLNLPEANHVICVELWWSPVLVDQAIARCWRVGQTKPVHSYKIIMNGSIEENIYEICRAKSSIANAYLFGQVEGRVAAPKLDKYTLGRIIGYYENV